MIPNLWFIFGPQARDGNVASLGAAIHILKLDYQSSLKTRHDPHRDLIGVPRWGVLLPQTSLILIENLIGVSFLGAILDKSCTIL